ncbi:hypothetical protein [Streptomyces sp. DH10]
MSYRRPAPLVGHRPVGLLGRVWEYFDIDADTPYEQVLAEERMPGAR